MLHIFYISRYTLLLVIRRQKNKFHSVTKLSLKSLNHYKGRSLSFHGQFSYPFFSSAWFTWFWNLLYGHRRNSSALSHCKHPWELFCKTTVCDTPWQQLSISTQQHVANANGKHVRSIVLSSPWSLLGTADEWWTLETNACGQILTVSIMKESSSCHSDSIYVTKKKHFS